MNEAGLGSRFLFFGGMVRSGCVCKVNLRSQKKYCNFNSAVLGDGEHYSWCWSMELGISKPAD